MPTITPADALIRAADDLTDALAGVVPPPNMTRDAVDQLMTIFKQQAEKAKDDATTQRVLKERARAERAHNEDATQPANSSTIPPLEVTYPTTLMSDHYEVPPSFHKMRTTLTPPRPLPIRASNDRSAPSRKTVSFT